MTSDTNGNFHSSIESKMATGCGLGRDTATDDFGTLCKYSETDSIFNGATVCDSGLINGMHAEGY